MSLPSKIVESEQVDVRRSFAGRRSHRTDSVISIRFISCYQVFVPAEGTPLDQKSDFETRRKGAEQQNMTGPRQSLYPSSLLVGTTQTHLTGLPEELPLSPAGNF